MRIERLEEPPLREAVRSTVSRVWGVVLELTGQARGGSSETPSRDVIRRLLALLWPHRTRMAIALAGVAVATVLGLIARWMVKFLFDAVVPGGDPADLSWAATVMVALFAGRALVDFFNHYLISVVGLRIVMALRLRLFEQLQRLSVSFYSGRRTGELVSRVMNDVNAVHNTVTGDLAGLLGQSIFFFGGLALIIHTEWRLTLLLLVLVPTVAILSIILGRIVREMSVKIQDEQARLTTVLAESIGGVRVVRSFVREQHMIDRFGARLTHLFGFALERLYLSALFVPLTSLIFVAASVALLWFGGRQVLAGRMSTGDLAMYISLTASMGGSIRWVGGLWSRLQEAVGSSQRVFELLDLEGEVDTSGRALPMPRIAGEITFEGVSFAYLPAEPERRETPGDEAPEAVAPRVLEDVSLTVSEGEMLAVVGPSGAGKTTLCNLVPRFFDPTEGRVLIDGMDLRDVELKSLREQIGVVSQDPHLFGGTIRDNLLFGKLDASEDEMVRAARAANAHDFILRQPDGYDTEVGEGAVRLSGGQRQRLAIARVLLKDPRILLLDEATSALDSESEHLVQEAMQRLMTGRTTIVIAHRLSTVRNAHRIAVLEDGRVSELGTHPELMAAGALYSRLYKRQFRDGDADGV